MTGSVTERLPDLLPGIRRAVEAIAAPGDVDDVTQECCVRLIEREHLWDAERGGVESWGAAVARRVALNWRRRRERDPVSVDADRVVSEPLDEAANDRMRWVVDQFPRLPETDREMLRMHYGEGRTMTEIAERAGISQPAVTKRMKAAIARLRRRARREGWLSAVLPISFAKIVAGAPKAAAAGLLVGAGGVASACAFWFTDPGTHLVSTVDKLKTTTMVAALDAPLEPDANTIWCATAPLAWAELKKAVGGDVVIENGPDWVRALNESPVGAADIDPSAFVAVAGRAEDGVIDRVQGRVERTFRHGRDPVLDELARSLEPSALFAYSFLAKDLEFPEPFDRLSYGLDFYEKAPEAANDAGKREPFRARAFGMKKYDGKNERHREIKKHVRIHGYESTDDFAVVLESRGGKDEVILARIAPGKTLAATIEAASAKLSRPAERLAHDDKLAIPVFDYHLTKSYRDVVGKRILNAGFEGFPVAEVLQTVRFRMNEIGVKLRSRSWFKGVTSRAGVKHLVFSGPFLVVLKEKKAANPYFAMWVATPEVLVPQE